MAGFWVLCYALESCLEESTMTIDYSSPQVQMKILETLEFYRRAITSNWGSRQAVPFPLVDGWTRLKEDMKQAAPYSREIARQLNWADWCVSPTPLTDPWEIQAIMEDFDPEQFAYSLVGASDIKLGLVCRAIMSDEDVENLTNRPAKKISPVSLVDYTRTLVFGLVGVISDNVFTITDSNSNLPLSSRALGDFLDHAGMGSTPLAQAAALNVLRNPLFGMVAPALVESITPETLEKTFICAIYPLSQLATTVKKGYVDLDTVKKAAYQVLERVATRNPVLSKAERKVVLAVKRMGLDKDMQEEDID